MHSLNSLKSTIFQTDKQNFESHALKLFRFQYERNEVYNQYVDALNISVSEVRELQDIPFLPIRFFKSHKITTTHFEHQQVFESSGTTGNSTSRNFVEDLDYYRKVTLRIFSSFYEDLQDSIIIGLLPSYLERNNSSLVFMVDYFIKRSKQEFSGFYLNNYNELIAVLKQLSSSKRSVYLFGVTFALLELAKYEIPELPNLKVIETGGMKGRGKEMVREELHGLLIESLKTDSIFSEYGMTELMSQAYMLKDGLFHTPPWMRILIREVNDLFNYIPEGRSGAINIIDLANVHSCAFIETEDLGVARNGGFNVIGRLDNSEMRGCNLLTS